MRGFLALCLTLCLAGAARAEVVIQQLTSPGGASYWLVEEPSIPIVAVEMDFRGGSRLDPEDRIGVSRFAMALMDEGAGGMDAVVMSAALMPSAVASMSSRLTAMVSPAETPTWNVRVPAPATDSCDVAPAVIAVV